MGTDDFPPLLPVGFHAMDLQGVRHLCVGRFQPSITRPIIMDGLEQIIVKLQKTGFKLEVWVNGSFLTEKMNPMDSDIVIKVMGEDYDSAAPQKRQRLEWFSTTDLRKDFRCDCYVFPEYAEGHHLYDPGQWRRAYWLNKFGFSRSEEGKGLAVLQIPFIVT